jgi:hypothetical protein
MIFLHAIVRDMPNRVPIRATLAGAYTPIIVRLRAVFRFFIDAAFLLSSGVVDERGAIGRLRLAPQN